MHCVCACASNKRLQDTLELEVQMAVSLHMSSGNLIQVLCKSNKHSELLGISPALSASLFSFYPLGICFIIFQMRNQNSRTTRPLSALNMASIEANNY